MKIKILTDFYDRIARCALRKAGQELSVSEERGKYLIAMRLAEEIEEPKPQKQKREKQ